MPQNLDIGEGSIQPLVERIFSYKGNCGVFDKRKLKQLVTHFELGTGILDKKFEELSGGEKQRIGIIISLLSNRNIYFLDEITSSLDAELKEKVIRYYLDLDNATELIISHDPEWEKRKEVRTIRFDEKPMDPQKERGGIKTREKEA